MAGRESLDAAGAEHFGKSRCENTVRTFLVIALLVLQAILAVGGRYTEGPVDGAVAAEEPANGADTKALLNRVGLVRQ